MSVRARLLVGMLTLLALGLGTAGVAGVLLTRSYLHERVDEQLQVAVDPTVAPKGFDLCRDTRGTDPLPSRLVITVLDRDGTELCTVDDDTDAGSPRVPVLPRDDPRVRSGAIFTLPSVEGRDTWRARATVVEQDGRTVVVAVSRADADATVRRLSLVVSAAGVAILLLTAVGAYVIVGLGLRPLHRIEDTAEKIAAGDLDERVPEGRPGTEVGRLSLAINGMLAQIERAFAARADSEARLRRFVADASHELRTPLSTIRGHAELFRQGVATSPEDVSMIVGRIESEAARMGHLVNDLLLLARLDQARPIDREPVDLVAVAADAVVDARARQPGRLVRLTADTGEGVEPPLVSGDEARLRQVLANLVSNVLTHTPQEAELDVSVRVVEDAVVVEVQDTGPGMPPDVVDRVFERFYRQDAGRSRKDGGTGLGLAIVRSLVEAHGGRVTCRSVVGSGTTFTVVLPILDEVTRSRPPHVAPA